MAKGLDWVQIQSDLPMDGDVENLSDSAFRVFVELICLSGFYLNDGKIPRGIVRKQCNSRRLSAALKELAEHGEEGLVVLTDEHVIVRNYSKFNRTKADVEEQREREREKKRTQRSPGESPGDTQGDSPPRARESKSRVEKSKSRTTNKEDKHSSKSDPLEGFEDWYELYPRKQGKGQAKKAWKSAVKKARPPDLTEALKAQLPSLTQYEKQYIPLASTWLNGERWEDEIIKGGDNGTGTHTGDRGKTSGRSQDGEW